MKRSLIVSGLFSLFLCLSFAHVAHAGTSDNVSGWAWSSNIGWISFNCTNQSTCATADYGVNKDGSGNLTGYAWSSTIGWIQFGGLSGFPTGSGTQSINAKVNGNNLQGWARALSNGSGWDGWIALSGSYGSGSYGVNNADVTFTGYAWGGDVVGWILFDIQNVYPSVCTDCGVTLSGNATLDVKTGGVSIAGSSTVDYGTIPTFEWTLTNMTSSTCSVSKTSSGGTSFTTVSGITSSGSTTGSPLTDGNYTYQIQCTGTVNLTKTVSFTVLPQPASFSIGGSENMRIQFLSPASAESETKGIFVYPSGGFSAQVNLLVTSFPTPPASTTFEYSFNGGSTYSANPGTASLVNPYSSGIPFRVRVTRKVGAPEFTGPFTITLTGSASGYPNATKDIILSPTTFTPVYDEL